MQIVLDTPIAFVGELLKLPPGEAVLLGELALKDCARLLYCWLILFSGRPLTRTGTKPGAFEVSAAKLVTPESTLAKRAGSPVACCSALA